MDIDEDDDFYADEVSATTNAAQKADDATPAATKPAPADELEEGEEEDDEDEDDSDSVC